MTDIKLVESFFWFLIFILFCMGIGILIGKDGKR